MMKRREFLKTSVAAAVAAPMIIPGSVLGKNGAVAPSDRIVFGCIGLGGQGRHNLRAFVNQPDTQIVALCDVDDSKLRRGQKQGLKLGLKEALNAYKRKGEKASKKDFTTHTDFREVLQRSDIDAVTVCTPDHWHGLISKAALRSGKDVYCEKPLVNTIAEGCAVVNAVSRYGRVLQTGSHERSNNSVRYAWELINNGRIGTLEKIIVNMPNNDVHHERMRNDVGPHLKMPVPKGFDYDMWLGPARWAPYTKMRTHFYWRFIMETGGGEMTDRGAHIIDLAQYIMNMDDSGPVHFEANGEQFNNDLFDAFIEYDFTCTYKSGITLIGTSTGSRGLKLIGSDGWIFINIHGGRLKASNPAILSEKIGSNEKHTEYSPGHHRNFLDSVKSRKKPIADEIVGHRTATICHLLNIGMLLKKTFDWDPVAEQSSDADVNAMLARPTRDAWMM
jgi:predicted dehydrogenase